MSVSKLVNYERDDRVAIVSLNRPEKLNALSRNLARDLKCVWDAFDRDDTVSVAVFRGEGRAFCAGADVDEMAARTGPVQIPEPGSLINECGTWLVSKPIVAAVHGWVVGAGTRQMLSTDYVVAAESMRFWFPELSRGLTATPVHHVLAGMRLLHLNELVYHAEPIDADTAYRMALVNRVVRDEVVVREAMRIAHRIARFSLPLLRATKRFMRQAVRLPDGALGQGALNRALLAQARTTERST